MLAIMGIPRSGGLSDEPLTGMAGSDDCGDYGTALRGWSLERHDFRLPLARPFGQFERGPTAPDLQAPLPTQVASAVKLRFQTEYRQLP